MNLKKLIKSIGETIKNFFVSLKPLEKRAIDIGVKVVDGIKKQFDNGTVDILTAIIPGGVDDAIAAKIKEALPNILIQLQLASKCMNETDPQAILKCAIDTLKAISTEFRKDFYDSLATQISLVVADGKLSWDDAKTLIKWYNDHVKKVLPEPPGLQNN